MLELKSNMFPDMAELATAKAVLSDALDKERKKCLERLSLADRKEQNILHVLELNSLSGPQMLRLSKCLIVCRRTRRIIKNRLDTIVRIKNAKDVNGCKQAIEQINKDGEIKPYTPKVNSELDTFDVGNYFFEDLREDYEKMFGKVSW